MLSLRQLIFSQAGQRKFHKLVRLFNQQGETRNDQNFH